MSALTENTLINKIAGWVLPVYAKLDGLSPVSILGIRLWVAWVFFKSGLTKINSWDSTLYLFEYEYAVPLLSPEIAAYMGTAAELSLPVLLALGLAGRFGAIALFIFNIAAVLSYPDLNAAGIRDHQVWGLMLLVAVLHGPGKLSIDHFLCKKLCPKA
ncbi:MAG: DoxX family protein [Ectothiorhodospiraceae bacterium]|nr:DoxX family protein [Ectothiorhodospiraceae bacterium]